MQKLLQLEFILMHPAIDVTTSTSSFLELINRRIGNISSTTLVDNPLEVIR